MPSIGRAQALAISEGFLDSLGATPPETTELPVIDKVLAEVALEFITTAVANLDKSGSVSTGELATSLQFDVSEDGAGYVLVVGYPRDSKAAKYYDFNNKGVRGVNKAGKAPGSPYKFRFPWATRGHALAILQWYRKNGISARRVREPVSALETKRLTLRKAIKATDSLSSMAYATAVAMKREGLAPSMYFDRAVAEVFGPDLMDALQEALAGDVILKIRAYEAHKPKK